MHRRCLFTVLTLGAALVNSSAGAGPPAAPKIEQAIVVFKTHFDIGYTDMAAAVVQRYRTTMIDKALEVCDQNRDLPPQRQFVWTIPGWPMEKILEDWPGQTPERQRRIQDSFRNGRFVVHALPFTTHTELLEPEDLVRGMGYSSRLCRATGLPLPRDAKMTDVPSHAWLLPTLLKRAGVEFLHLGCNGGSHSPNLPDLFWWEGPDGSRVLTMYSQNYGTGTAPPANWPHRTWLILSHTGDNHGPPQPQEVQKVLDEAAKRLPGAKLRIGRLSDFADAVLAEKPDLPVVRADMPDTWIHGPLSDPQGAALARQTRMRIAATESLCTLMRSCGMDVADPARDVAAAYEQSLLYGEHTWGAAQYWLIPYKPGSVFPYGKQWADDRAAGRFQRWEASWAEHSNYIREAAQIIGRETAVSTQALARQVNVHGPRVVVYNPLPWKRGAVVSLVPFETTQFDRVVPADGAGPPAPLAPADDGIVSGVCFRADDLPPLGYRTYRLLRPAADARAALTAKPVAGPTLETKHFKVQFDVERGTIRSLVDKRSGRELVGAAPYGFGQYLYERFDAQQTTAFVKAYAKRPGPGMDHEFGKVSLPEDVPYRAASPTKFTLAIEERPTGTVATLRAAGGGLSHGVTTQFTFNAAAPLIDIAITLHEKPADPWPEAGWLCLPAAGERAQFRVGRPGAIIDPVKDVVAGSNHHLMAVHTGVAMLDAEGRGLGVCPIDHALVSLDSPGCWKYSPNGEFKPQRPVVYVNLFNNQWSTNFRYWNEGTWTSRVRVWPIERYSAAESLVQPALEARMPPLAAFGDGGPGNQSPSRAGVSVSRGGVMVTALGANPDGPGTLLRLWDLAGAGGPCQVRLPAEFKTERLEPVDLRGRPQGAPLPVRAGVCDVPLGGFAPASLIVR